MAFALNDSSVDATIGRLHVVTLGVRERVVKPATEFAGNFTMSRIIRLSVIAAIFTSGLLLLAAAPGHAGSTSAQLRVNARVIKSCKVSTDALASKAASGTINVNCQNSALPAGSNPGSSAPHSGTANVNYSVDEVPGSDGTLKIVTVNY
jgi:hypothetical protein